MTTVAKDVGTWSEAAAELDEIVRSFDDGEVTVDDLIAKLERATIIIGVLETRLTETRAKVDELVPKLAKSATADE